ncbi:putative lipoprotein (plasmid) [Borrelia turicatae 91E135]|uniref:Lipoprotein n=1 Tax=Borrelia turicatae (strain 91E135) TaxID=314724 RepID=A0ABF7R0A1_BORT9|nr:putative lipoprotein [Borrelia turicatae 91E135]
MLKVVYKIVLLCIFIFCSCNFDTASRFFLPLEESIKLEIAGYEYLGGNKFRTRVHSKEYFDSVKDINGYSYYFILDKDTQNIEMQVILYSKVAGLLDYKFGFIFDFGFKFDFFNAIPPNSFEFQVKKIFKREIVLKSELDIANNSQFSTYTFSLEHIKKINREFEIRNHEDDINSSTSELMYFVGSSKYSTLREAYIVFYYYVFKAIERFM